MKLRTDDELSLLTKDDILQELSQINELAPDDFSKDNLFLLKKLKNFERTRHLMMWHDGSTLSSHSYLLMMVSIMYDSCVSDRWRIWTEISYFSWHTVNCRKTTSISTCTLPIKWSTWGTPEECLQDILNLNLTITSSKHITIFCWLPSLKQANKKEVTFFAFHVLSTLRQYQVFFIHQRYLTCHCRTE